MTVEDRGQVLTLVTEAVARVASAYGVRDGRGGRTHTGTLAAPGDGRRWPPGAATAPRLRCHMLSGHRRWRWRHVRVSQCESASDRPTPGGPRRIPGVRVVVLPRAEDGAAAGASRSGDTRDRARPRAYLVTAPRTLFSGDITYPPSSLRGQYDYLYLFMDVFSRKAVGAEVHAEESMAHSSQLLETICRAEGIEPHQVSVHADNGGAMKGSTSAGDHATAGRDALVQSPVGQPRQSVC